MVAVRSLKNSRVVSGRAFRSAAIFGSNTHSRMLLPEAIERRFGTAGRLALEILQAEQMRARELRQAPAGVGDDEPLPVPALEFDAEELLELANLPGIEALLRRVAAGRLRDATRFRDAAEVEEAVVRQAATGEQGHNTYPYGYVSYDHNAAQS